MVEAQQDLHKQVANRVEKTRELQRRVTSRGQLPNFMVGDYVLAARVRRAGTTPKLVSTWTGPWRIVAAEKKHVYGIQNIVNGEVRDAHVARLRYYADKELEVTAAVKEVFQHAFAQGKFEMEAIVGISEAQDGDGFDVQVEWVGFGKDESSWEPLETILKGAPQFVRTELRKLRLTRKVRARLLTKYCLLYTSPSPRD